MVASDTCCFVQRRSIMSTSIAQTLVQGDEINREVCRS